MSTLRSEIYQQPETVRQFIQRESAGVGQIARAVAGCDFDYVLIAARGTSDNAARYGQYLFGMLNRLPVALAAPSLFTAYNTPPRLSRALVIGISQSGQSPDVVSVLEEAQRQGAPTIAITNDAGSPLALSADHHIFLGVGEERSVAATKTYTGELAAMALLSISLGELPERLEALRAAPGLLQRALEAESQASSAANTLADFDHAVVIGRGINYATAFETALKIKELSYLEAEPFSSADFRHGPMALADPELPVVVISAGATFRAELSGLRAELRAQGAKLVILGDADDFQRDELAVALPQGMPEWLSPLVAIVPGQLMAYYLSMARGHDPDQPRTIHKVTKTL